MGRQRRGIATVLVGLGVLVALMAPMAAPRTARASAAGVQASFASPEVVLGPGDPLGLLRDRRMLDSITLGTDVVAVVRCRVPEDTTNSYYSGYVLFGEMTPVTVAEVVPWLQENVTPYFAETSGGRMNVTFRAGGTVELDRDDGIEDCKAKSQALTRSTDTNVLAFDSTLYTGGSASSGSWGCVGTTCSARADSGQSPATSGRGAWVGGGSVGTVSWLGISIVAHELGHTYGWPHSYNDPFKPYDNKYDLMSGTNPDCEASTEAVGCIRDAQHTLAINRYAAGWISPKRVRVIESGSTTVDLAAPLQGGVQMLVVRLSKTKFLTLEARPLAGRDVILPKGGVAVHRVDVGDMCRPGYISFCQLGQSRVQVVPAKDVAGSVHVQSPGQVRTVSGVLIEVLSAEGSGYRVRVTES